MEKAWEVNVAPMKAGGDASEMFELVEAALDMDALPAGGVRSCPMGTLRLRVAVITASMSKAASVARSALLSQPRSAIAALAWMPASRAGALLISAAWTVVQDQDGWSNASLLCKPLALSERRGGESNPRIEVLQTSALPLGYPAVSSDFPSRKPFDIRGGTSRRPGG